MKNVLLIFLVLFAESAFAIKCFEIRPSTKILGAPKDPMVFIDTQRLGFTPTTETSKMGMFDRIFWNILNPKTDRAIGFVVAGQVSSRKVELELYSVISGYEGFGIGRALIALMINNLPNAQEFHTQVGIDNLRSYYKMVEQGMSAEDALASTHLGSVFLQYGFKIRAEFVEDDRLNFTATRQ